MHWKASEFQVTGSSTEEIQKTSNENDDYPVSYKSS